MGNLYLLTHKVKIRLGHLGHPIAPWRTRNGAVQPAAGATLVASYVFDSYTIRKLIFRIFLLFNLQ